jgi:hypothetical protein
MNYLKRKRRDCGGGTKWEANMFAKATCLTRMRILFITRKCKSSHYLTQGGGARMTEARVPKIDTGRDGEAAGGGGGGGGPYRVQVASDVTSVEEHPGTTILNRKTKSVKLHSHMIITSERTNRD